MTMTDGELAVAAAAAGAAVVRARYGTPLERYSKGGTDFATAADLEAERAILDVIRAARPDDAFLGEEGGLIGSGERTWMVDPLCGTLNFAAHTPLVAVNVALRTPAGTVAAAVVDPFAQEVYRVADGRAELRRDGAAAPLTPSGDSTLVEVDLPGAGAARFVTPLLLTDPAFLARFDPRVISSTLGVVWVASGRRAAFVIVRDVTQSVQFAAGLAVCRAAGCVVTDLLGGAVGDGPGLVVAADETTHGALLPMLAGALASCRPADTAKSVGDTAIHGS
jgi:myo-inositol-1(or 4)-monophosphatase